MSNKILFNVFPKDTTKGNEQVYVLDLKTIYSSAIDKNKLPAIQMFNNGQRVLKDEIDWNSWNNIVWVDVDSKYFFEEDSEFLSLSEEQQKHAISEFIKRFEENLMWNYYNNYYALNVSKSGKGFKVLFYFDCEKTKENYLKCTKKAISIIIEIAHKLDVNNNINQFSKIINYISKKNGKNRKPNPVLDRHVLVFTQPFDVSPYDLYLNNEDIINSDSYGKCDLSDIDLNDNNFDPKIDYVQSDYTTYIKKIQVQSSEIKHFNHDERWRFYKALIVLLKNKELVDKEYENCMKSMPGGRHSLNFYLNEPKSGNWYKNYFSKDYKYYVPLELLDNFGYIYKEKDPNNLIEFEPDRLINLKPNEYIGNFKEEIYDYMNHFDNVEIVANCGSGKSFFFRDTILYYQKCIIVVHLNSIKDSVYKKEMEKYLQSENLESLNISIPTSSDICKWKETSDLPDKMILGWNQLALLCIKGIDLNDYIKLFDEIHNIIHSLRYRYSVIKDIVKNNEIKHKCIIVTATPCGEHNIFNHSLFKFKFIKEPKFSINYYLVKNSNDDITSISMLNTINNFILSKKLIETKNSKFVIFDNRNHQSFFDYWHEEYAMHCCKYKRNQPKLQELFFTHNLEQNLFITTTFGLEGIEIKNKIENLFILIPLREYEITTTDVEQLMNRFRNVSKQIDVIFFVTGDKTFKEDFSCLRNDYFEKNIIPFFKGKTKNDLNNSEEYFLQKRIFFEPKEIVYDIEPWSKVLKLYYTHYFKDGLSCSNLRRFYPDLKQITFDFEESEKTESSLTYYFVGNHLEESIGNPKFDSCSLALSNYLNEDEITIKDVMLLKKIRTFNLRVLEKYGIENALNIYVNEPPTNPETDKLIAKKTNPGALFELKDGENYDVKLEVSQEKELYLKNIVKIE